MSSTEVKINQVAERLPLDEWFTKVEFSEFTGIKLQSCTRRLNKIIAKGMLKVDSSKRKNYYMMDAACYRKMMMRADINKTERELILDSGRKSKPINRDLDRLLSVKWVY